MAINLPGLPHTLNQRPAFDRFLLTTVAILALRLVVDWTYSGKSFHRLPFRLSDYVFEFGEQTLFMIGCGILMSVLLAHHSTRVRFLFLTSGTALFSTLAVRTFVASKGLGWPFDFAIATGGFALYPGSSNTIDFLAAALFGLTVSRVVSSSWRRGLVWGVVCGVAAVAGQVVENCFGDWPREIRSLLARYVVTASSAMPFCAAVGVMAAASGAKNAAQRDVA